MRKKIQHRSGKARFVGPYLDNFNLPTPSLTPEERSRRQKMGQRSIIVDDIISIDVRTEEDDYPKS
jgi:hypothetical protein